MTPAQQGHVAMLTFSALVAGSFSLGAMAANEIAPAALNAARFGIAGCVVAVAMALTTGLPRDAFKSPWRYVVLGGLFAAYFVLMFEGLKTAKPVSAASVFTLIPIMSAGFGWLLLRQVTTARMASALAIGGFGAVWVIFRGDISQFLAFEVARGEAVYFLGCVCHAAYTPMVRKLNRGEPAVVFTFGVLVAGGFLLTIYGWEDIRATQWQKLPGIVWVTLLYVAIFASAATFVLLQYATLRLPSAKVMAYTYLTPSWVILWEVSLGNGLPGGLVIVGVVMTVLALWMLLRDEA